MNSVFVYCEIEEGTVADVSLELLTKGRALATKLGVKLEAIALGEGLKNIEKQEKVRLSKFIRDKFEYKNITRNFVTNLKERLI